MFKKSVQRNFQISKFFNVFPKYFTTPSANPEQTPPKIKTVLYNSHNKNVFEICLNQPQKLNAIDIRMIKSMLKRVREWTASKQEHTDSDESDIEDAHNVPRVVMMSGAGKAFCAGGDINTLYWAKKNNENEKILKDFFRYEYLLDYSLATMTPIHIPFWHGVVMGGGVGLSINAPIRIATENALFAMPETKIGLFPDVGASYFLPRILKNDPSLGLYLALTGDRIKGLDLVKCGIATHFVPSENLEELKKAIIEKASSQYVNDKDIFSVIKNFSEHIFEEKTFELEKEDEIRRIFDLDQDIDEIFEKLQLLKETGSETESQWAQKCLDSLNKASPISLVVTMEQMRRGAQFKNIEEAYNLEAQLVAAFVEDSDFFEGVRALLIEKDNKPEWRYKSTKEINKGKLIQKYFERAEEIQVDEDIKEE